MATYGINLKIDVSKIDKSKMYKGAKGTYLDAVVFVDVDEKDQYDNNGMIKQDWKDADKKATPILGNCRVFWSDNKQPDTQQQKAPEFNEEDIDDEDIPF